MSLQKLLWNVPSERSKDTEKQFILNMKQYPSSSKSYLPKAVYLFKHLYSPPKKKEQSEKAATALGACRLKCVNQGSHNCNLI